MTAPFQPNTQGLVQTILTIRQLQQQDAAQQLAREQFGLTAAATGEQMLGHLGTLASSLPDPKVLLPQVDSLAKRTGLDPETLRTIFSNAVPSTDVTKSSAVAKGVAAAGEAINQPAAYSNIVGQQPGQLQFDDLQNLVFKGAHQALSAMSPEDKQTFNAEVASKVGTGMSLGDATMDATLARMPQEWQQQALTIGKGLAPSADATIQARLGAGQLALQTSIAESEAAYRDMQIKIAMAAAQSKLNGPDLTKALDLIKAIAQQQQFMTKQSGVLNEEGQKQQNAVLNSMYMQLREIDPTIGKLFEDVPDKGGTLAAPGALSSMIQGLRNKMSQP